MVKDLSSLIGKQGNWFSNHTNLVVVVTIQDARVSYGKIQFLVTPVEGHGVSWVNSTHVTIFEHQTA